MEQLEARWDQGLTVCVGLDSEYNKLPPTIHQWPEGTPRIKESVSRAVTEFNQRLIEATHDLVACYKPNWAFYLPHGADGIEALATTIQVAHLHGVPVILDAKVADIGNTNKGYVDFVFDYLKADAVTVHPYLGSEAMEPFLSRTDKGVFVLARTSNPGAGEFQDRLAFGQTPLYELVAKDVQEIWNTNGNCGIVSGATYPEELAKLREVVPTLPFLIPGIGAQGGDVEKTVKAAKSRFIVNSSRGIIFASNGADFAEAARAAAQTLHDEISQHRSAA